MDGGTGFRGCDWSKGFFEMHRFGPAFKRGGGWEMIHIDYLAGTIMDSSVGFMTLLSNFAMRHELGLILIAMVVMFLTIPLLIMCANNPHA